MQNIDVLISCTLLKSRQAWPAAGCKNGPPVGFNYGDRPTYATRLACCKGAYGGQTSGVCLSQLPSPPTQSPTDDLGGRWWPDYATAWSDAGCKNGPPVGFNRGDRPEYDSQLACCKAAYGGQMSGEYIIPVRLLLPLSVSNRKLTCHLTALSYRRRLHLPAQQPAHPVSHHQRRARRILSRLHQGLAGRRVHQ